MVHMSGRRIKVEIYHKVSDLGEYFVIHDQEYEFATFAQILEFEGLTSEDFELINEGPELEAVPDCIAIWRKVDENV